MTRYRFYSSDVMQISARIGLTGVAIACFVYWSQVLLVMRLPQINLSRFYQSAAKSLKNFISKKFPYFNKEKENSNVC